MHILRSLTFALLAVSPLACGGNVVVEGAGASPSAPATSMTSTVTGTPTSSTPTSTVTGTTSSTPTSTVTGTTGSTPTSPMCLDAGTPAFMDMPGCPCTRRIGTSAECPAGSGVTATKTIGPSGGSISLMGNQGPASGVAMELDFPPMALATDTQISITETNIPPPFGFQDWSPVWRFDPMGLELHAPVQMKMPDSSNLTSVPNLVVYWSTDGCTWTPLADSYNNAGFMNASTTSFGYGFVGVPKPPAQASCP